MSEVDYIKQGDCLGLMKELPNGCVDMVLCDLPYGVLHKDNPHAQWDRIIPFEPLWEQYERVIKPNGAILLFAQGMFTAQLMMSNPKMWRYNLVWDKCRVTGFLNANRMPMRCHEGICVFYKSLPTYNPQYELGAPNHPQGGGGKHKQTNRCYGVHNNEIRMRTYDNVPKTESTVPEGMKLPRSIVAFERESNTTTGHPTQKPVNLLRYLIATYSNEGDVILDNTMGSGSICVAAVKEHRHFIGYELTEEYFNIAKRCIELEQMQPTLFLPL